MLIDNFPDDAGDGSISIKPHNQNNIAEKKIRDLVENANTQLIYAMHLWAGVIKQILWPLALKAVVRSHNKF